MENEHCTNVGRFRASRDVPLPYEIETKSDLHLRERQQELEEEADEADDRDAETSRAKPDKSVAERPTRRAETQASGADLEAGAQTPAESSLRQRRRPSATPAAGGLTDSPIARTLKNVGSTMLSAHAQDYERRRKPEPGNKNVGSGTAEEDTDDDEDEDEGVGTDADSDSDEAPGGHREQRSGGVGGKGGSSAGAGGHGRSARESRDLEEALERAGRGSK